MKGYKAHSRFLEQLGVRIEKWEKDWKAITLFFSHRCRTMDLMSIARLTKPDRVIADIKHTAGQRAHGIQGVYCGIHWQLLSADLKQFIKHVFIKHKKKKTMYMLRLLSGFTHLLHTICSKPLFWPLHVCLETAWSWNQLKHWRCFHPLPHGQSGEAAPLQRSVEDPPKKQKQDVFNYSKIG